MFATKKVQLAEDDSVSPPRQSSPKHSPPQQSPPKSSSSPQQSSLSSPRMACRRSFSSTKPAISFSSNSPPRRFSPPPSRFSPPPRNIPLSSPQAIPRKSSPTIAVARSIESRGSHSPKSSKFLIGRKKGSGAPSFPIYSPTMEELRSLDGDSEEEISSRSSSFERKLINSARVPTQTLQPKKSLEKLSKSNGQTKEKAIRSHSLHELGSYYPSDEEGQEKEKKEKEEKQEKREKREKRCEKREKKENQEKQEKTERGKQEKEEKYEKQEKQEKKTRVNRSTSQRHQVQHQRQSKHSSKRLSLGPSDLFDRFAPRPRNQKIQKGKEQKYYEIEELLELFVTKEVEDSKTLGKESLSFLMSFPFFSTSLSVLEAIVNVGKRGNERFFEKILKTWMERYPEDWDINLSKHLEFLLSASSLSSDIPSSFKSFRCLIQLLHFTNQEDKENEKRNSFFGGSGVVLGGKINGNISTIDWTLWNEEHLAEQLFRRYQILFSEVRGREFFLYLNSKTKDSCRAIRKAIQHFNQLVFWVVSEIVVLIRQSERVALIEKIVRIATHSLQKNDFFSSKALFTGVRHPAIARMKRTLADLTPETNEAIEKLQGVVSIDRDNGAAYRQILKKTSPPYAAFVGLHLKDMTFINDSEAGELNGKVNYQKYERLAESVQLIMRGVKPHDGMTEIVNEEIQRWITNMSFLSDDDIFKWSKRVEPRNLEVAIGESVQRELTLTHAMEQKEEEMERKEEEMEEMRAKIEELEREKAEMEEKVRELTGQLELGKIKKDGRASVSSPAIQNAPTDWSSVKSSKRKKLVRDAFHGLLPIQQQQKQQPQQELLQPPQIQAQSRPKQELQQEEQLTNSGSFYSCAALKKSTKNSPIQLGDLPPRLSFIVTRELAVLSSMEMEKQDFFGEEVEEKRVSKSEQENSQEGEK